jgi:hypothetical protein
MKANLGSDEAIKRQKIKAIKRLTLAKKLKQ